MKTLFEERLSKHLSILEEHFHWYFRSTMKKYDYPEIDLEEILNRIGETKAMLGFLERNDSWYDLHRMYDAISDTVDKGHLTSIDTTSHTDDQRMKASIVSFGKKVAKPRYDQLIKDYLSATDDIIQRDKARVGSPDDRLTDMPEIYRRAIERNHLVPVLFLLDENDEEQSAKIPYYEQNYEDARQIYAMLSLGNYNANISSLSLPSFSDEYLMDLLYKKQRDYEESLARDKAEREADAAAAKAATEAAQSQAKQDVENVTNKVADIQAKGAEMMAEYQKLAMAGKMDEAAKLMEEYQKLMASL